MAELDDTIVFRGAGGIRPDYNRSARETIDIASAGQDLKQRQLKYQDDQILLKQHQDAAAQEKIINETLAKAYKDAHQDPLTPTQVKEQGGSAATPTATDPSTGRPTLKKGDQPVGTPVAQVGAPATAETLPVAQAASPQPVEQQPLPDQTTSVAQAADTVQPGANGMPGPGGVTQSGEPIQQISPATPAQDRPSIGEMMGPVASPETVSVAEAAQPQQQAAQQAAAPPMPVAQAAGPQQPVPQPQPSPAQPQAPQQPAPIPHPADFVGKVRDALIAGGHGGRAFAFESAMQSHLDKTLEATAKRKIEEVKAETARHGILASHLEAFIEGTPTGRMAAEWPGFVASEVRSGHLTQEEVADYRSFPGADKLPAMHTYLVGQKAVADYAVKHIQVQKEKQLLENAKDPAVKAKREADLKLAEAKASEALRENDANILGSAAKQGQAAYTAAYNALPGARRTTFTPPDKFNPATIGEDTMLSGMTNQQKATYFERQISQASIQQNRDLMRQQGDERIALQREAMEDRRATKSATSKAEFGRANTEINKLQAQERALYPVRNALGTQIMRAEKGQTYTPISDKGLPTGQPITAKNDLSKDPVYAAMKERYADLGEKAAQIISDKYDVLEKVGGTPKMSREAAVAGLHKGGVQKVEQPKQQAPPPQPPQQQAPPPVQRPTPGQPPPARQAAPAGAPRVQVRLSPDATGNLQVGGTLTLKSPDGKRTITVIKDKDGNVYQQ